MSMVLPTIEHATVTTNAFNRVIIQMDDGWVFWRRDTYRDENGEIYEPAPEDISYFRYANCSATTDFSMFVVVAESDVPADQIF